ncbi:MAG: DNA replication protein RecF [Gracilibacter sp. BRH_c7a]|nr:MAG: DNA replication protein RecF [Gracilibacter sp. BRH_c7a]
MYIKDLHLKNFRNYKVQHIQFQQGINLLIGSNGQGKTNIIEAINYLLTGKSYRIKQEDELILWEENSFYLNGIFNVVDRDINLESYYEPRKKVMKINQLSCKKLSDYVGTINAVFFSPDDLNIIKKGPQERRRFLDHLISQLRPAHIPLLNSYLRIIKQKNILLKSEKNYNLLKSQIQVWNEQLIELGLKIIKNRWDFTDRLNEYCSPIFNQIFSPEYNMDLIYLTTGKSLEEALENFPDYIFKKMAQEIERKAVLVGPHRDDVQIIFNNKEAKLFASQGQQRALVLCLKLAEMEIILNEKGEYPILLLDDVLSELDSYRRQYLMNYIRSSQKQTIITMTDLEEELITCDTPIFEVNKGRIRRKD